MIKDADLMVEILLRVHSMIFIKVLDSLGQPIVKS